MTSCPVPLRWLVFSSTSSQRRWLPAFYFATLLKDTRCFNQRVNKNIQTRKGDSDVLLQPRPFDLATVVDATPRANSTHLDTIVATF